MDNGGKFERCAYDLNHFSTFRNCIDISTGYNFYFTRLFYAGQSCTARVSSGTGNTLSEREQCKQLVAEAKQLATSEASGEYIYRVRDLPGQMKVTKIRVRS